jgi:hypothetical protein
MERDVGKPRKRRLDSVEIYAKKMGVKSQWRKRPNYPLNIRKHSTILITLPPSLYLVL